MKGFPLMLTPRRALSLGLSGLATLILIYPVPVQAGERTLSQATVDNRLETEIQDGKLLARNVKKIRKRVEVDILVPETRTRQVPYTRNVPKANPYSAPGIPAAGERIQGNIKTNVTLSSTHDDTLHATTVSIITQTWMEPIQRLFALSNAQGTAVSVRDFASQWMEWVTSAAGSGNEPARARTMALVAQSGVGDVPVPSGVTLFFTESGEYVGALGGTTGTMFGNYSSNAWLVAHYGEGGVVTLGGRQWDLVASFLYDPIALDLNHDGRINVTGKATGAARFLENMAFNPEGSVTFDLRGIGKAGRFEWLQPTGDGLLVDDRGGKVSKIARKSGEISGLNLFDGHFDGNGFQKLARLFAPPTRLASAASGQVWPRKPILSGAALRDLKVWIDSNHDARVTPDELKTCQDLGITEIDTAYHLVGDKRELRQISTFTQDGVKHLMEDVWFAEGPRP